MKKVNNENIFKTLKLPDLFSVVNALLGFSAILFVLSASTSVSASSIFAEKLLGNALILVLIAAVVDGLDGMIARSIEHSHLGRYLDSLADMLSFGVAPSIVAYVLLRGYEYYYIASAFCGAYVISGMLRLARFDAKPFFRKESLTKENYSPFLVQVLSSEGRKCKESFEGFPITGSAIFLASFMLLFIELPLPLYPFSLLLVALIGVLCLLMISRIEYRNIRDKRITIPVGVVFFTLFLFYLFSLPFIYPVFIIFILSTLYVCSPITR